MVKVCHMTSAHNSNDVRIFYKECTSLAAAGYETYLVARGDSREENGVHVVGLGEAPASRRKRMTSFANAVYQKALSLDCEIYHLHDPELLPYGVKLKKQGKKVIFDSHENTLEQMDEKAWIPVAFRKIISSCYRRYATGAFEKMDALISVTPHIIDQLKNINPNTWMITNYPIYKEYSAEKKSEGLFSLCFTGGISSQWCHEEILDSILSIDGVVYHLCGKVEDGYLSKLKNHPAWNKVKYFGSVPFEKAVEIQAQSDVGMAQARPSKNSSGNVGTLGNTKLFEYMMMKLPIICTDFKLWSDIIARWQCGICVSPDDSQALTEAVLYLRDHPEEAKQMGENGRRAAKEEFNWGTQEKVLLKLYREIGEKNGDYSR